MVQFTDGLWWLGVQMMYGDSVYSIDELLNFMVIWVYDDQVDCSVGWLMALFIGWPWFSCLVLGFLLDPHVTGVFHRDLGIAGVTVLFHRGLGIADVTMLFHRDLGIADVAVFFHRDLGIVDVAVLFHLDLGMADVAGLCFVTLSWICCWQFYMEASWMCQIWVMSHFQGCGVVDSSI